LILRALDPTLVNRLVGRDFEGADFTEVLAEPMHVCLTEDDSGAIFMWRGPGVYEVHVFFSVRGREAIRLGHRMLNRMREEFDALLFWALVPVESRNVIMFTRLMGWKHLGQRQTRHGLNELFALENGLCLQ
jgi:hypothetical protein